MSTLQRNSREEDLNTKEKNITDDSEISEEGGGSVAAKRDHTSKEDLSLLHTLVKRWNQNNLKRKPTPILDRRERVAHHRKKIRSDPMKQIEAKLKK